MSTPAGGAIGTPAGEVPATGAGAVPDIPTSPAGDHPVRLIVTGRPVAQEGTRAVPTPRGTRWVSAGGKGLRDWRASVAEGARLALLDRGQPFTGPVCLEVEFRFPMPKSRPAWQRLLGRVPMCVRPDLDKLQRAVMDGLVTGGLLRDDATVAEVAATKCEYVAGWHGADITVSTITVRRPHPVLEAAL